MSNVLIRVSTALCYVPNVLEMCAKPNLAWRTVTIEVLLLYQLGVPQPPRERSLTADIPQYIHSTSSIIVHRTVLETVPKMDEISLTSSRIPVLLLTADVAMLM